MKCSKCGAECDPRQLFCLKCGAPLDAQPDGNKHIREIEVPPVEDSGTSMDDMDNDIDLIIGRDLSGIRGRDSSDESGGKRSRTVSDDRIDGRQNARRFSSGSPENSRPGRRSSSGSPGNPRSELHSVSESQENPRSERRYSEQVKSEMRPGDGGSKSTRSVSSGRENAGRRLASENAYNARPELNSGNPGNRSGKKAGQNSSSRSGSQSGNKNKTTRKGGMSRRNTIIAVVAGVAVIAAIAASATFFIMSGVFGGFDKYYQKGMKLYDDNQIQSSITQFIKAADHAKNDTDKADADEMLWKAYSQTGGYEQEQIDVLTELISLKPDNAQYYEGLITLYQSSENYDAISDLIDSVEDPDMQKRLREYDQTALAPTVAAGEYDRPVQVGFTAASGSTVYYTINGATPSDSSDKYTSPIDLAEEGEYVIKAVLYNEDGERGKEFEGKYVLKFATVNPPVVSLDSGTYTERKKVKVTADAGCSIYYTTDGSVPDKNSKKYKKPFRIPEKNTVYFFIAVSAQGVESDMVTRVYDYKKVYTYTYDGAVSGLSNVLVSKGVLEDTSGSYEDGSVMYFSYRSLEEIDKEEYYIIDATRESEDGSEISSALYAFGADNGLSYQASGSSGNYELNDIE